MTNINFSCMLKQPTKKQKALYKRWKKYLTNSKLSEQEIHKRASLYASNKVKVNV